MKEYKTLEEMAAAYSIPSSPEANHRNLEQKRPGGKDEEWAGTAEEPEALGPGPWYALRLMPKVHHTMGGINMNTKAQATDVSTDKPIAVFLRRRGDRRRPRRGPAGQLRYTGLPRLRPDRRQERGG